jgi:hypothetical protein
MLFAYVGAMGEPPDTSDPQTRQPLPVLQSFVSALKVYVSNANTLFVIVAIFVIPATIATFLLIRWAVGDPLESLQTSTQQDPFAGMSRSEIIEIVTAFIIGVAINFVISMIAVGACYRAVHEALRGNKPDRKASIQAALEKLGSLVWLPILIGLLFVGGALVAGFAIVLLGAINDTLAAVGGMALFGAGIYVFVSWSLAIPVLMAEDKRGLIAITRSQQIVKGQWVPTFGLYVLAFLVMAVVSAVLSAVFSLEGRTGAEGYVLGTLAAVVSTVIFTPFQAALVGVVYARLGSRPQPLDDVVDSLGE